MGHCFKVDARQEIRTLAFPCTWIIDRFKVTEAIVLIPIKGSSSVERG